MAQREEQLRKVVEEPDCFAVSVRDDCICTLCAAGIMAIAGKISGWCHGMPPFTIENEQAARSRLRNLDKYWDMKVELDENDNVKMKCVLSTCPAFAATMKLPGGQWSFEHTAHNHTNKFGQNIPPGRQPHR